MQRAIQKLSFGIMLVIATVVPSIAQERGTPEEAQSLTDRAVLHMRDVGAEAAIKDFNDPKGGYAVHDLFVIVYDPNGVIMSGVPALIGKDARTLTDVTGKEFGK